MTIYQLEDTYIQDLNDLDDWFLQYEYLLAISADMPRIADNERTPERKVPGCQSGVWLILNYQDGCVHIQADSEALIIRGIVSIYVQLLNGRTPKEILGYTPRFIERTNIRKQVSTDRFRGLNYIFSEIRNFAATCNCQEGSI